MSLFALLLLSFSAFAGNNLCVVQVDGQEITIGQSIPYYKQDGSSNILMRMKKGDFYYCDIGKDQSTQKLNISADSRKKGSGDLYISPIGKIKRLDDYPEIYLDGDVGKPVTLINLPGKTSREVIADSHVKAVAEPIVGSQQYRFFLTNLDYRFIPNGNSGSLFRRSAKVIMVKNTPEALAAYNNKNYNHPDIKEGWINQNLLRNTPFPKRFLRKVPREKKEGCTNCALESPGVVEQIKDLLGLTKPISNEFKKSIIDYLFDNRCFEKMSDAKNEPEIAKLRNITEGMKKFLRRSTLLSDKNFAEISDHLTAEKISLMRMLAFTMWGEMRQTDCPTRFEKAVARIALNRAELLSKHTIKVEKDTQLGAVKGVISCRPPSGIQSSVEYFKSQALSASMACMLGAKVPEKQGQFLLWDGNDDNYDKLKCLEEDKAEYRKALDIAFDIVTNLEDFKSDTKSLEDVYYYTSDVDAHSGLKEYKKSFSISDGDLDNTACLRLWYDPNNL